MKTDTPHTIFLKDYTVPAYLVDTVDLDLDIRSGATTVTATLAMRRNPAAAEQPLILDGDELETLSVTLNGQPVDYTASPTQLSIASLPEQFTLQTVVRIDPDKNTVCPACTVPRTAISASVKPRASAASRGLPTVRM